MEILKDASSTAIYGSRGSNGVILITTKQGSEGKAQVTFDASVGLSTVRKQYDLLNAYEYATALNDIADRLLSLPKILRLIKMERKELTGLIF